MNIQSIDLLGNSSIGIFGISTNTYALFPYNIQESKIDTITETLDVPVIQTTLNNSNLLGLFAVGNSNHLLLPRLVGKFEEEEITKELPEDISISLFDSTITALGNVIIATDDRALVSNEFTTSEKNKVADYLDVEVASYELLNSTIIGSMVFGTDKGMLVHPLVSDESLDFLEDYFKVPVDVVTVNRGTPYPRPGIIGNNHGVLVGSDTTGPELMRIYDVLLS